MVELGAAKVGHRLKNDILGQISQAILAILKRFEILHILSSL